MKTAYDTIKNILRTEKGSDLLSENKYLFHVARDANKVQIKQAIEEIYNVKVVKVNTVTMYGKWKRLRFKAGRTSDWKKAVVMLKDGNSIEVAKT
ncbi:MAG: 50S ribosomal protein L23 [Candidatus Omnitrophica bacterium]|nr:50S ribosomal protein L23 [Candidatus Omnitrophota bacterium]MBU4457569.1 50S ribosomal protein L23 [Candidatus Omnitrophota bacterium]